MTPYFRVFLVVCMALAALILAVAPVLALSLPPGTPMPCKEQGGCVTMTHEQLEAMLDAAEQTGYKAGKQRGIVKCGRIL